MLKSHRVVSVLTFFLTLKVPRFPGRLSVQEQELIDQYRSLTETDRVAMRYLIGAMKNVSRF